MGGKKKGKKGGKKGKKKKGYAADDQVTPEEQKFLLQVQIESMQKKLIVE